MKKTIIAAAALVCASASTAGEISVSSVSISQDLRTRLVTVEYTLGDEPAIVTVDFLTNGVSIGEANFANVIGDVNRLVSTSGRHVITWRPDKSPVARVSFNGTRMTAEVKAWPVDDPPDYMVALLGEDDDSMPRLTYYVSTNALPGGLASDEYRTTRLVMRRIHAAGVRWRMGAVASDFEGAASDKDNVLRPSETAHYVTLSEDYFIGIYEITQEQFRQFTGIAYNGSAYSKSKEDYPMHPRHSVEYRKIRGNGVSKTSHTLGSDTKYLQNLRNRTGVDFDLPTDAQWEYAARGGTTTLLWSGKALSNANVMENDWIYGNSPLESEENGYEDGDGSRHPHRVGLKPPNPYGLYDMLGNVNEICMDGYIADLGTEDVTDPINSADAPLVRGGNFNRTYTPYARVTYRGALTAVNSASEMSGFRVACPIALKYPAEVED